MIETLWNRFLESVADRGRELLGRRFSDSDQDISQLSRALLTEAGEASGTALAREMVRVYKTLDEDQRSAFFNMLVQDLAPDPNVILAAAERYGKNPDLENYLNLAKSVEAPRQELFRRINRAPQGIEILVKLREHLLSRIKQQPDLRAVDADLKHLFRSWFNPGFLQLRRIDWNSPAAILEKLVSYEAVHAIQGWKDMRRRLDADRRCFAFFHPMLPNEPLIFVEVALVKGMSDTTQPLLELESPVLDPKETDTAIFFSINNCQIGLRGVSFGNFLIKQVMAEIMGELPGIKHYATLSPLPSFATTLKKAGTEGNPFTQETMAALLEDFSKELCARAGLEDPLSALFTLLDAPLEHQETLSAPLERLVLVYFAFVMQAGGVIDPVAYFHLSNGACLERINPFADSSAERLKSSFGTMVNYRYEPNEVERNHERFVTTGEVALAKPLMKEQKRLISLLGKLDVPGDEKIVLGADVNS